MQKNNKQVYKKLQQIATQVDTNFRNNGVSIPARNDNGNVEISGYTILYTSAGLYDIVNVNGHVIIAGLNLAETAVLLANYLSLGRFTNKILVQQDRDYGYMQFEKTVFQKNHASAIKRCEYDRAEFLQDKYNMASNRAETTKKSIDSMYKKLQNRINNLITPGN